MVRWMVRCRVCVVHSGIRLQASDTKHWSNRNKLSTEAWEMYESTDLFTLDRKHKSADVEQLGDIWTSTWETCTHEIWYTINNAVSRVKACRIECYRLNHQTENCFFNWVESILTLFSGNFFSCAHTEDLRRSNMCVWTAELTPAAPDGSFSFLLEMNTVKIYNDSFY